MSSLFYDVEVLWISRFDYEQSWYLQSHAHTDFYQLLYVCEGSCVLKVGNSSESVKAPQIVFIPPKNEHEISRIQTPRLVTLDVKFKVHNLATVDLLKAIPPISSPKGERLKHILEQIIDEGFLRNSRYQEMCSLLMGFVLLLLIRWNDETTDTFSLDTIHTNIVQRNSISSLTQDILNFLQDHYANKITSDELASRFNYSYRYLSEVFNQEMQMSPLAYQEKIRIARAKDLMNYTQFELKQISNLTGFATIHQFSKRFKLLEGVPPGQWRTMRQQHIREDVCIDPEFVNKLYVDNQKKDTVPD